MNRFSLFKVLMIIGVGALVACAGKKTTQDKAVFTEIDSLTEIYLTLEDSMLNTWNAIAADENEKIKSLHELLHTLMGDHKHDPAKLNALEHRLDELDQLRFDQNSMGNPHAVEEYDFASNSLVNEILTFTESNPDYATDKELQELVADIKIADQHIPIYRADYDSAATRFNDFLDRYKLELNKLDESLSKEKKPLF